MLKTKSFWLTTLALLGLLDAIYLTYVHFNLDKSGCSVDGSCNVVLTSKYAEIFGIPTAFLGVLYYAVILLLVFIYKRRKEMLFWKIAKRTTILGFIASIVLIYIQTQILGSICQFCMFSAGTSTLLFLIGYSDIFKKALK